MNKTDFEKKLRNLRGTFAVENMQIRNSSLKDLENLTNNKETCSEIVERLKNKYMEMA